MRPRSLARMVDEAVRCEFMFAAPFAFGAGGLYGRDLAGEAGLPAGPTILACAVALTLFVGVQLALEPWAVEALGGPTRSWSPAVAAGWDGLTGVLVGTPVLAVLDTPPGAGVALAAAVGSVYALAMGWLICRDGPGSLALFVLTGGSRPVAPDGSHALALEARGDAAGARSAWRRMQEADPADPAPYFALARLHVELGEAGRHAAVAELRGVLDAARATGAHRTHAVRRIVELRLEADELAAAAPDLARYLDRYPDDDGAPWALGVLGDIKRQIEAERRAAPPRPQAPS